MASPQSKTVVIVCPHCTTRYQVPGETVGPKGRQVQCAHCSKTWQAFAEKIIEPKPAPPPPAVTRAMAAKEAEDDLMFDAAAEAELDAAFEAEQKAAAEAAAKAANEPPKPKPEPEPESVAEPPATPVDAVAEKKRQKAFSQRQSVLTRQLPMARVRRTARIAGLATLVGLIVGGYVFRTDVVRLVPDMAGAYELLGLGVNVIGLEFRDVKTLLVRHDGTDVMQVDAKIMSVAGGTVSMPPVVVTLVNDEGLALYEWSVVPDVGALAPGEIADFSTRVNAPPSGATKVRLTFGTGQAQAPSLPSDVPVADAADAAQESAAPHEAGAHDTAASETATPHEPAPAHAEAAADHSGGGH